MTTLKFFRPVVAKNTANEYSNWSDVLDRFFEHDNRWDHNCNTPKSNILEFDDHYRIDLYVPGVAKEDIKIDLENEKLTISKPASENQEEEKFRLREFGCDSFERSFNLSSDIDTGNVNASHNNGILSVTLPKKEEAKPVKKTVEIQ